MVQVDLGELVVFKSVSRNNLNVSNAAIWLTQYIVFYVMYFPLNNLKNDTDMIFIVE